MIASPSVVHDLPEDVYHADPVLGGSLSHSASRKLLAPYCPAIFRYEQDHPRKDTETFAAGRAAHTYILGTGQAIEWIDADSWRGKDAREARDDAIAAGKLPRLIGDRDRLDGMRAALRADPIVSRIITDDDAASIEASMFAPDPETGITLRARYDYMRPLNGGRVLIVDYKTANCAHPRKWRKSAGDYGYHTQDAWYSDLARTLGLGDPIFVFVVQDKEPPYLPVALTFDEMTRIGARERNRRAIRTYAECVRTNTWPGYADQILTIDLPSWVEIEQEQESIA